MVKIIDDWYFETDDKQYILIHRYEKKRVCLARRVKVVEKLL